MQKTNYYFIGFLISFLTMTSLCGDIQAKDYQMSGLEVNIQLQEDGSMLVEEHREFTFQGKFSEVFRSFPLDGQASFSNFRVSENETDYPQSTSQTPGTFMLDEKSNELEVRIFADMTDTTRTFTIHFEARGAMERYEDAALLYYQIISDQWSQPIHNIHARIIPPEPLSAGEPAHWVHGSLEAVSAIKENGVVEIELERLPGQRYLEIRALYPAEMFAAMPVKPGNIREQVMQETARLAEEANRLRQEAIEKELRREIRFETGRQIAIPLALLVLLIWVWLFRKYHKKPVIRDKEEVFAELPDKDLPALVSYLYFQTSLTGQALISTLFHLAYRKFITIREEEVVSSSGKKGKPEVVLHLNQDFFNANKNELLTYEKQLLTFLFEEITLTPNQISLKQIRKKSSKMQTFFPRWKKNVYAEAQKKEWYNAYSKKGRNIGLVTSLLLMIAFAVSVAFYGPWMLIPLGISLFFMIGSLLIYHRTEKGEIAYQRWKRLRKRLKKQKFDNDGERMDINNINEYLIYGVALGLGSGFYKKLFNHLEQTGNQTYLYWIILHQSSMNSFSKNINKVITSTGSSMSSSSGAGGGGTMGGGGGAASGGGGAR